jgi:hypothetical protein
MPAPTSNGTSTTSAAEGERGSGVLGSIVGVTVFLVLLLFGSQLALNLYATSAVTGVAFDAARAVAGSDGGPASIVDAESQARSVLGRFADNGGRLSFDWNVSRSDSVVLTVHAERPSLLRFVRTPFARIDRTVHVRWERPR